MKGEVAMRKFLISRRYADDPDRNEDEIVGEEELVEYVRILAQDPDFHHLQYITGDMELTVTVFLGSFSTGRKGRIPTESVVGKTEEEVIAIVESLDIGEREARKSAFFYTAGHAFRCHAVGCLRPVGADHGQRGVYCDGHAQFVLYED